MKWFILLLLVSCATPEMSPQNQQQYCWNWLSKQITEDTTLEEIRNIKLPAECEGVVLWDQS